MAERQSRERAGGEYPIAVVGNRTRAGRSRIENRRGGSIARASPSSPTSIGALEVTSKVEAVHAWYAGVRAGGSAARSAINDATPLSLENSTAITWISCASR